MLKIGSKLRKQIIEAGEILAGKGLLPATSGNLSMREPGSEILTITVSGKCKGKLEESDFLEIDLDAKAINDSKAKPSAETLLHTQIYKFFPEANAVFHIHSINSVVISKLFANSGELKLSNYELLKALTGVNTHQATEIIPIFRNTQNIANLAAEVQQYMQVNPEIHAYLIEAHGLYCWGETQEEALRQIEALETLFAAELKYLELRGKL